MKKRKTKRISISFKNSKKMTRQEFKNECDINNILKSYQQGKMPKVNMNSPEYKDVSSHRSFKNSYDKVLNAQEKFYNLPSEIRKKYGNDIEQFLVALDEEKKIAKQKEGEELSQKNDDKTTIESDNSDSLDKKN